MSNNKSQQEPLMDDESHQNPIEENIKISFANENPTFHAYLKNSLDVKCISTYIAPVLVIITLFLLFIAFLIIFAVKAQTIQSESSQFAHHMCTVMSSPFNCDMDDNGNFCQYNVTFMVSLQNITATSIDKAVTLGRFYYLFESVDCWVKQSDIYIVSFRNRDSEYSDDVFYIIFISIISIILLVILVITTISVILTFRRKYKNREHVNPHVREEKLGKELENAFQEDQE